MAISILKSTIKTPRQFYYRIGVRNGLSGIDGTGEVGWLPSDAAPTAQALAEKLADEYPLKHHVVLTSREDMSDTGEANT
jgi:hypothetical protein